MEMFSSKGSIIHAIIFFGLIVIFLIGCHGNKLYAPMYAETFPRTFDFLKKKKKNCCSPGTSKKIS